MHSLLLSLLLVSPCPAPQGQKPSPTVPLFNGEDLSGWHGEKSVSPYAKAEMDEAQRKAFLAEGAESVAAHWSVADGELVNDGHGAFLTTDRDYGDAVFTLDYKTVANADSGIYLRGCPQVQIWDYTEAGGKWNLGADKGSGGLWNNKEGERFPPAVADKPFGEWNSMKIAIVGERVWVTLNGKTTTDGVRLENYWDRSRPLPRTGPLQLQTHGGEIRFRNLTVQELTPAEADRWLSLVDGGEAVYESVFDGESFAGWRGDKDSYVVEQGAVRCKPGKGGNLFTEARYGDFSARLRFRLPPGGNNGLAIRYPGEGNPAHAGVELQVLDNTAEKYADLKPYQFHGSVYGVAPAQRGYLRPVGQWNWQQVTVVGSRYVVELNGFRILDCDVSKLGSELQGHVGKDRAEGHFGFCGHNDPVAFRDISIRRF